MKPKKNIRKDLESKKVLFFEVGLAITLLLAFLAFEWKVGKHKKYQPVLSSVYVDETVFPEIIETTPAPETPPVEKIQVMVISDVINIGDNDIPPINIVIDAGLLDTTKFKPMVYKKIEDPEDIIEDEIIPIYDVKQKPTFKGKDANTFVSWVYNQLVYPDEALKNNVEGNVYLSFVIGQDGKLSNIQTIRASDSSLADEVIRVVKKSPDWEAGMQGIRKVKVSYQLTIRFKIQQN